MQNYHKHTCFSNVSTPDSTVSAEDYAKRAVELGQKVLSTCEHGWQGNYFADLRVAKKYGLQLIFVCEAYWVWDRHESDRTNNHIILIAKTENGRKQINEILSTANEDGYYYKPRIDKELLFSLSPEDVIVCTACIAFYGYGIEETTEFILQLYSHFGENFFLEVQYQNIPRQLEVNRHLQKLHYEYDIPLIVGLDSHYIYPEQAVERDEFIKSRGLHYDDEDGMYLDYPDEDEVRRRFKEQGILTEAEVEEAMANTDVVLTCDRWYEDNWLFDSEPKIPSVFPNASQEEINRLFKRLVSKKLKEYLKKVPPERHKEYIEGVKMEVDTYIDTGMASYPLLDYLIVQEAKKNGGLITQTGRGSAVGFMSNTLLGFSSIDRFTSEIPLLPARFMSTTRILETKSLPDLDLNLGNVEIFADAQKKVLGENSAYPMVAFGTAKKKSAFKIYARAKGMEFSIANEISGLIERYEKAVANAEEDEKDTIDIYDFVPEKYREYIEGSKAYWGIITDRKKAPSAYLLHSGDVRKDIGLMKCKSEATKKEYLVACMDGAVADTYKYLKNDLLKVDVVLLINKVFERIGIEPFDFEELKRRVDGDKAVWDVYGRGLTVAVNQCERESTIEKLKRYRPVSIAELARFIAAIRPGFASMYSKFESREHFEYGIPALDNAIQNKDTPDSFIMMQEQIMVCLQLAGFPMDETYGVIKAMAKKKADKVMAIKGRFVEGFKQRLLESDPNLTAEELDTLASRVWQILEDNSSYSFNACIAGDTYVAGCDRVENMLIHQSNIPYYGVSMMGKNVGLNRVVEVRYAGNRDTYRLITADGQRVDATINHKFPTPNGEKRLDELEIGDTLYTAYDDYTVGTTTIKDIHFLKKQDTYDVEMADPYHNFALNNGLIVSNSHAYSMAGDSLYCAYLKAHYTHEFYEVMLQYYSDKGVKDKVSILKAEMPAFGIHEGPYRFRLDNRKFLADPANHQIIPSLLSIKHLNQKCANTLYELGKKDWPDFITLYHVMKQKKLGSDQIRILIDIDYFSEFGTPLQLNTMVELYDLIGYGEKQSIPIAKLSDELQQAVLGFADMDGNILTPELDARLEQLREDKEAELNNIVTRLKAETKTKKAALEAIKAQADYPEVEEYYRAKADFDAAAEKLKKQISETKKDRTVEILKHLETVVRSSVGDYNQIERVKREYEALGYLKSDWSTVSPSVRIVLDLNDKYKTRRLKLLTVATGEEMMFKMGERAFETNPVEVGDIVALIDIREKNKMRKNEAGDWEYLPEKEWHINSLKKYQKRY